MDIFGKIAKKYGVDKRIVELVCHSPFRFAKLKMAEDRDVKDIRFPYLFKLRVRKKYKEWMANGKSKITQE